LLNSFQTQIGVEVTALAGKVTAVGNCNSAGATGDTNAENNAIGEGLTPKSSRDNHADCRALEKTKREAVDTACVTITDYIDNFVGQGTSQGAHLTCEGHAGNMPTTKADWTSGTIKYEIPHIFTQNGGAIIQANGANIEHSSRSKQGWIDYINDMNSFWTGAKSTWDNAAPGCQSASEAWDTQQNTCSGLQTTHYNTFCLWVQYRRNRCLTLDVCYPAAETEYTNMKGEHETADANRIAVTKVVQRVICLVNALQDTNTPTSLSGFIDTANDACVSTVNGNVSEITAAMSRTKPTIPAKASCSDVAKPWPEDGTSNGNFYNTYYSGFATDETTWGGGFSPAGYAQYTVNGGPRTEYYNLNLAAVTRTACNPVTAFDGTYTAVDRK